MYGSGMLQEQQAPLIVCLGEALQDTTYEQTTALLAEAVASVAGNLMVSESHFGEPPYPVFPPSDMLQEWPTPLRSSGRSPVLQESVQA